MSEDIVEANISPGTEALFQGAEVFEIEIGGKSPKWYLEELEKNGIHVQTDAAKMIQSPEFNPDPEPKKLKLVKLRVADLVGIDLDARDEKFWQYRKDGKEGLLNKLISDSNVSTRQIFEAAQMFGLEVCPPEVGPALAIDRINKPIEERNLIVAMNPIIIKVHDVNWPMVFAASHNKEDHPSIGSKKGFGLGCTTAFFDPRYLDDKWQPETQMVFRLGNLPVQ